MLPTPSFCSDKMTVEGELRAFPMSASGAVGQTCPVTFLGISQIGERGAMSVRYLLIVPLPFDCSADI